LFRKLQQKMFFPFIKHLRVIFRLRNQAVWKLDNLALKIYIW